MQEKVVETKQCKQCLTSFHITDSDVAFYNKISPVFGGKKYGISTPKLCPDCRNKNKICRRNENKLYKRCDVGKTGLSIYSPDKKHNVVSTEYWWSDNWNPLKYGKDFDPSKSFFEQIKELIIEVPTIALNVMGNENCDYVNCCGYSRNCYLSYNTDYSENMLYCSSCIRCKDCMNLYKGYDSALCYESVDLYNCYNVYFSQFCFDCSNSSFLLFCKGCSDCYGCINLVNKKYCIFNEQFTKEEYEKKISEINKQSLNKQKEITKKFFLTHPHKFFNGQDSLNCSGNYLFNNKNVFDGFDINDSQDLKYCDTVNNISDCHDRSYTGYEGSQCYQLATCGDKIHHSAFSVNIWSGGYNIYYSILCINIKNCFGCVGLRNKEYCILNKQYTKQEYEELVPKIIEKMIDDGERGEFFPASLSPFGYNETVAMEYFPLTKQQALAKGFNRSDYEAPFPQVEKILKANELPNIQEVTDEILQQAIECEVTKKPFRIIKQKLNFYRKHNLPLPTKHPDQRHKERMTLRNPRKLRDRKCMKCGIDIKTSYSTERPEIIYCEDCYNKEIYG